MNELPKKSLIPPQHLPVAIAVAAGGAALLVLSCCCSGVAGRVWFADEAEAVAEAVPASKSFAGELASTNGDGAWREILAARLYSRSGSGPFPVTGRRVRLNFSAKFMRDRMSDPGDHEFHCTLTILKQREPTKAELESPRMVSRPEDVRWIEAVDSFPIRGHGEKHLDVPPGAYRLAVSSKNAFYFIQVFEAD